MFRPNPIPTLPTSPAQRKRRGGFESGFIETIRQSYKEIIESVDAIWGDTVHKIE